MEPEVGKVYTLGDGSVARYVGGPITKKTSWEYLTEGDPTIEAQKRLASEPGNALTDAAVMATQGASFGFADELGRELENPGLIAKALQMAGLLPKVPEGTTARFEQRVEDLRTLAPGASLISEMVGSAAVPFGSGKWAARAVGNKTGFRTLGAAAGGGVGGLLGGAAYGAGEAEGGPKERVLPAVKAGAAGAGVGGVLGGLLGGAGRGAEALFDAVRGKGGPTQAAQRHAQGSLRRGLMDAEVPPGEVRGRVQAIGPDAVVADLADNLRRRARTAINQNDALTGPRGPVDALERRAAERGERIATDLRTAAGVKGSYLKSIEAAEEAVQAVREDFYRPLERAFPRVNGRNVAEALMDPEITAAARRTAPDLAPTQGEGVAVVRPPTFRELQDIMMDLRDEASAARAAGRPNRSQKANAAFDKIAAAMEKDIPGFREAQNAYRVAQRRLNAHEMGRKAAYRSPDEIIEELKDLPEEAREAYRRGLLDRFEVDLLEREGGGGRAVALSKAGESMEKRIRALAESDPKFSALLENLDREGIYSRTWSALSGNSSTAQQQSDLGQMMGEMAVSKAWVLRRLLSMLVGLTPDEYRQAAGVLGQALLTDGEEAARLLAQDMMGGAAWLGGGSAVSGTAAGSGVATERGGGR